MITVTDQRTRGSEVFDVVTNECTVSQALNAFIYKIGCNELIQHITETEVEIQTCVLNCVDTVTYRGTPEEMELLVEAAEYATRLHPLDMGPAVKDAYAEAVMRISGEYTERGVVLAMIGPDSLDLLRKHETKDLKAAMQLIRIDGFLLTDVLFLLEK